MQHLDAPKHTCKVTVACGLATWNLQQSSAKIYLHSQSSFFSLPSLLLIASTSCMGFEASWLAPHMQHLDAPKHTCKVACSLVTGNLQQSSLKIYLRFAVVVLFSTFKIRGSGHEGETHPPKTTHPNKNTVCANNFGAVCANSPPFFLSKTSRKQAE